LTIPVGSAMCQLSSLPASRRHMHAVLLAELHWQSCSGGAALAELHWRSCTGRAALTELLWQSCTDGAALTELHWLDSRATGLDCSPESWLHRHGSHIPQIFRRSRTHHRTLALPTHPTALDRRTADDRCGTHIIISTVTLVCTLLYANCDALSLTLNILVALERGTQP